MPNGWEGPCLTFFLLNGKTPQRIVGNADLLQLHFQGSAMPDNATSAPSDKHHGYWDNHNDHDVVVVTYAVFIAKQFLSQTSRPSNEVV